MSDPNIPLIGEANEDFESKASPAEKAAAERARRAGGVVQMNDKTAEQHAQRERSGRLAEQKTDQELERNLDGEIRAKYKIEITFVEGRTVKGPNRLGIQIWESGKRFHGGGDELMFWCRDNRKGEDGGCWAPIPSDCIRGGVAICPKCKRAVNANLLTNMRLGYVTSQNLAKELSLMFRQLESNADFYIKYHKTDIHYIAMERDKGPDVARRLKGMHIFPLMNIIRNTATGASLEKLIYSFITS
jgi:hypothetical protein